MTCQSYCSQASNVMDAKVDKSGDIYQHLQNDKLEASGVVYVIHRYMSLNH